MVVPVPARKYPHRPSAGGQARRPSGWGCDGGRYCPAFISRRSAAHRPGQMHSVGTRRGRTAARYSGRPTFKLKLKARQIERPTRGRRKGKMHCDGNATQIEREAGILITATSMTRRGTRAGLSRNGGDSAPVTHASTFAAITYIL